MVSAERRIQASIAASPWTSSPGSDFAPADGRQAWTRRQVADQVEARPDRPAVFFGGKVVGEDHRIIHRIGRAQRHPPPAFRPKLADVDGEAVAIGRGLAVVAHDRQHAMELKVGPIELRPGFHEAAGLQEVLAPGSLCRKACS